MAKITGNKVKFTWSGTTVNEIFETRGHVWGLQSRLPMHDTTSELATSAEYTPGVPTSGMVIQLFVDSADDTPTIPTGTSGTMTLYPYHAAVAGDFWTATAYVESMQFRGQSTGGAPPEVVSYTLRVTGDLTRTAA